jgi:DNA-binding SARP family transcriptional activator
VVIQQTSAGKVKTTLQATTSVSASLQQYDVLLGSLLETERLEQNMIHSGVGNLPIQHTAQLYQRYLKNLLDMQDTLQCLQQGGSRESRLSRQLETLLDALQERHLKEKRPNAAVLDTNDRNAIGTLACNIQQSLREGEKMQTMLQALLDAPTNPGVLLQNLPTNNIPSNNTETAPALKQGVSTAMPVMPPAVEPPTALKLDIYLFGEFKANFNSKQIKRWPHGKGQQIFKYLLLHRAAPVRKERLMETFWPDIDARAARNNLNVSIYYLRQDLSRYHKTFQFVLYQDDCYRLNPDLSLWVDVEAFDQAIRTAHRHLTNQEITPAIAAYRDAEALYQGDCLQDETNEWASLTTQAYRARYLEILGYLAERLFGEGDYQECANLWQKAVALDSCDERAHRKIMQCYLKVGQRQLALRQYHFCVEALHKELGLEPSPKTLRLLEQIRRAED